MLAVHSRGRERRKSSCKAAIADEVVNVRCISNLFVYSLFEAKADEQNAACFSLPVAITGHPTIEPDAAKSGHFALSNKNGKLSPPLLGHIRT